MPQVSFKLGNLIFPNEMIPERVPCELAHQSMILMCIVAALSEYEVRIHFCGDAVDKVLDLRPLGRKVPVAEVTANHLPLPCPIQPPYRALLSFFGAFRLATEDHPPHLEAWMLFQ